MKLIVQIPCHNEAATLMETVRGIPRKIAGVDQVEILVVDDGSADGTATVAQMAGVEHIVRHRRRRGLARAFRSGLDACLRLGADIIVNTDGDNQYVGGDVPLLIRPLLEGRADIVIGDRETAKVPHFSRPKRLLEGLGSLLVGWLSDLPARDAVSGFRALTREAAFELHVFSRFSYTIDTLLQAGDRRFAVMWVPVRTNPPTRASRLTRGTFTFIACSAVTALRGFVLYYPLRTFFSLGAILAGLGLLPIVRFLIVFGKLDSGDNTSALILGGMLLVMGFSSMLTGLMADLFTINRGLAEETLERIRTMEAGRRFANEDASSAIHRGRSSAMDGETRGVHGP